MEPQFTFFPVIVLFFFLKFSYFLATFFSILVGLFILLLRPKNIPQLPRKYQEAGKLDERKKYDFVVVGSGSSGCVLTHFLVKKGFSVLLLEAGQEAQDVPQVSTPYYWWTLLFSWLDWDYFTVPQPNVNNREIPVNKGKTLGGSSSINACMWVKGCAQDYDTWGKDLPEDAGWSYEKLIPFFQSLESYPEGDPTYRGHTGPLKINSPASSCKELETFILTAENLKHPRTKDYNDGKLIGVNFTQENNGDRRHDCFNAFVKPLLEDSETKTRIDVISCFHATKLLFSEDKSSCIGIQGIIEGNATPREVYPAKEVLLSAGSIGTPQLLMLSGIGPADHLTELGIPVLQDLPVGKNYHDHPFISVAAILKDESSLSPKSSGFSANLHFKSQYNKDQKEDLGPDMQIITVSGPFYKEALSRMILTVPRPEEYLIGKVCRNVIEMTHNLLKTLAGPKLLCTMGLGIVLNQPYSRGEMKLRSTDPFDKPLIDPKVFSDKRDLERLIETYKHVLEFPKTEPLASQVSQIVEPNTLPKSDNEIIHNIKKNCGLAWHPVGTCKMGPQSASDTVVDENLKVLRVQNLRVIDASIMPRVVSGNTNMASLLIGAKGAERVAVAYHK